MMLVPRAFSSPVGIPGSRVMSVSGNSIKQNVIRLEENKMNCIYDKVDCRFSDYGPQYKFCKNCVLFQILNEIKVLRATL